MSRHSAPDTVAYRRTKAATLRRDGYRCQLKLPGCLVTADQCDHVIPMSKGGDPLSLSNCRAACAHCNASRGDGSRENIELPHRPLTNW